MIVQTFAIITGVLMSLGYYPQAWHIFKTKSAGDISVPSFIIFAIGTASWFAYGWYLHDVTIIVSFGSGIIGSWATLFLSIYYRKRKTVPRQ